MSRSDIESRSDWLSKASILTDALPFMRRYADSRVVVKFGGHAMGDGNLFNTFASDMVLLRQVGTNPIVVHGEASNWTNAGKNGYKKRIY